MVKAAVTPRKVKRIKIPSATTAIIMGTLLGVAQALLLIFGAKVLLRFMGVKTVTLSLSLSNNYGRLMCIYIHFECL